MGKTSVEVDTYKCSYCGYEHYQLNKLVGQSGALRYVCGDCWIKALDRGLRHVNEPKRDKTVVENRRPPSSSNKGTTGAK